MKQNETTGGAHLKGATINREKTPNIGQALKDFIMSLVVVVRMEVEERKKSLDITDEQLVEKILTRINVEKRILSDEKDCRKFYGAVTREVVWNYVNVMESERIISRLKSGDQLFAQKFFYGTNNDGCNISRFRSKIISQIKQTYHYDVSVEEFGNIVYTHLWDNGTWSVLDNYAQKSSFFCWLEQVARHEVMRVLEDMKAINVSRERTVGNTRLLGMSIDPEIWEYILSDIMPNGIYKNVLTAILVDRKKEKDIIEELRIDIDSLHDIQKEAEADLKDKIIRSNSYYEELVLRDKSPRSIEVSEEFAMEFTRWQEVKGKISPLADIFDIGISKDELQEKVVEFLYTFSEKLKWSDEDRLIWTLRFIENTAPVEVAGRLGKKRSWIDTRYSRLNSRFNKAIKEWWYKNT